ncbi:MAG: LamG domain-containing protein, partial [Flavobacteriales bacterium]
MKKFNCIQLHAVLIAACLSLCVSTFVRAQLPSYVPSNGLVAWYPFNGNANDESGNGNNGVVNGATLEMNRNGIENNALGFWNANSNVSIQSITQAGIVEYSVAGWFKKSTESVNQEGGIFCGSNPCNGPGGLRFHIGSTNQAAFGAEYQNCSSVWAYSQNKNYSDNSWHSFALIFNSQPGQILYSQFIIYIDGIQIQSVPYYQGNTSVVISPIDNSGIPTILGNAFGGGDHFKGVLDDIGIWNRALSPSEIEALYTSASPCETTVASIEATIIEGETYDFNGQSLTAAGNYEAVLTNAAGCDSVVTLTLTVDPSFNCEISSLSSTVCLGDSVSLSVESVTHISIDESVFIGNYGNSVTSQWNNTFETEVGRDYKLVVSGLYTVGTYCPQLVYDPAYQLPGFYGYANPEILDLGGIQDGLYCTALAPNNFVRPTPDVYNPNHIYEYYFTAISNSFNVGFNDCCWGDNCGSVEFSLYELSAGSNFLWSTGETTPTIAVAPTETTTYSVTVTQGNQTCTSDVIITVNQPSSAAIEASIIEGETYDFNGQSLTSAGTYEAVFTNAAGCDSLVTLMLSVEELPLTCNIDASSLSVCSGEQIELTVNSSDASSGPACLLNHVSSSLLNGLVAWYPFCGNANDASGNENNCQAINTTLIADRFGNPNSAYSFDGSSSHIIGSSTNLPGQERTVSVWFYSEVLDTRPIGSSILGYGGTNCGNSWLQVIDNLGNLPSSQNAFEVQGHCNNVSVTSSFGNNAPVNQWHNWVVVTSVDGTNFYLDGVQIASSQLFINNTYVNNRSFVIGATPAPNGYGFYSDSNVAPWLGSLDDIGIWNRRLTQNEILELFQANYVSSSWSTGETTPSITVSPTETTTYSVTVTQGNQTCTSDVIITVNQPSSAAIEASIIEGETYEFNGQSLIAAGTYEAVLTNAAGCDSLVTLTLSVEELPLTCNIDASSLSVCSGEQIELTVNSSGASSGPACLLNHVSSSLLNGLVAWYPFCGNANDASGNENNCQAIN